MLGCSTAVPHAAWPAAGFLVEWEATALLLDVGQGVVRRLQRVRDPRGLAGVIVGHMHADHYIDLAALRYLFPWAGSVDPRLPVHLPPGGRARIGRVGRGDLGAWPASLTMHSRSTSTTPTGRSRSVR